MRRKGEHGINKIGIMVVVAAGLLISGVLVTSNDYTAMNPSNRAEVTVVENEQSRDKKEAEFSLESLKLNPLSETEHIVVLSALLQKGRTDDARQILAKYSTLRPDTELAEVIEQQITELEQLDVSEGVPPEVLKRLEATLVAALQSHLSSMVDPLVGEIDPSAEDKTKALNELRVSKLREEFPNVCDGFPTEEQRKQAALSKMVIEQVKKQGKQLSEEALIKLEARFPQSDTLFKLHTLSLIEQGNYEKAKQLLEQSQGTFPKDVAFTLIADLLKDYGDLRSNEQKRMRSATLNADLGALNILLSECEQADVIRAEIKATQEKEAEALAKLYPEHCEGIPTKEQQQQSVAALKTFAQMAKEQGEDTSLLPKEKMTAILKQYPQALAARKLVAAALLNREEGKEALTLLSESIDAFPKNVSLKIMHEAFHKMEKSEKAAEKTMIEMSLNNDLKTLQRLQKQCNTTESKETS